MEAQARGRLEVRLRELERELVAIRRSLAAERETLPDESFEALELLLDGRPCLVPVRAVREVVPAMATQPLPDAPPWVRGTFRYGTELVPLIDLRQRLGGAATQIDPAHRVVVVEGERPGGLLTDEVGAIVRIDPAEVVGPAEDIPQAPFLLGSVPGAGSTTAHLLSVERLCRDGLFDDADR